MKLGVNHGLVHVEDEQLLSLTRPQEDCFLIYFVLVGSLQDGTRLEQVNHVLVDETVNLMIRLALFVGDFVNAFVLSQDSLVKLLICLISVNGTADGGVLIGSVFLLL